MDTTPNTNPLTKLKKINTGIPGLDTICHGGIPKGRTTLVAGTPGSAKTIIGTQFVYSGIKQFNEPAVFVTFEEAPDDIKSNVRSFGWELEMFESTDKLVFIDVSVDPSTPHTEAGNYDFTALISRVEYAIKKINAKRVCIDSIATLFSQFHNSGTVRHEMRRLEQSLKQLQVTTIITCERLTEYGDISRDRVEEFVSDNVILLRNVLDNEHRRRTIEILKLRGTSHQKGEFPFSVSTQGVEILPLSAIRLPQLPPEPRVSSGNIELDKMCGGGFFQDSIILCSGATGTGKSLTVSTFLNAGCVRGERVLLFSFKESREQLCSLARNWGMDFEQWEKDKLLKIVCLYPEAQSIEDHLIRLRNEIKAFSPKRLAFDCLSAMERICSQKSFREFTIALTSLIKSNDLIAFFASNADSLVGGSFSLHNHFATIVDTIILLRYVEVRGEMRRGLMILKMRGSAHDKSIREYIVTDKGLTIGSTFENISGIFSDAPIQLPSAEHDRLNQLFEPSVNGNSDE
ncbi:MAG: circadian clock protein KaiC [Legionellales bacterium]|nr:circadian clock protein KaiC [Legionellales bacterium]|tara:strand:- start:80524 stop:82071 length:1548 start_codon:yes stop_codon:yes gene_type:complete